MIDEPVEQEVGADGAVDLQHRIDRLEPLAGFERIDVARYSGPSAMQDPRIHSHAGGRPDMILFAAPAGQD